MVGRRHFWVFRRHHVIGAGTLASLIGVYSFGSPGYCAGRSDGAGALGARQWRTVNSRGQFQLRPRDAKQHVSGQRWLCSGYAAGGYPTASYPASYAPGDIACYFSPKGGCADAVVGQIRQARQQILVQAYSFTSVPIATALVEARQRGVNVYIVLDKSQRTEKYSGTDYVATRAFPR